MVSLFSQFPQKFLSTSRNCSSAELMEEIYKQIFCNAQIYQPILDILQQCERPEYEIYIGYCGLSETNQFGIIILNETYPEAVESQCQNYTQGCTPSCHAAFNTFKTALGCCVNAYNNSHLLYYNTSNPALWSACDIPTPGFCPSTCNSALRWDFPNITLMPVVLVVLNLQM